MKIYYIWDAYCGWCYGFNKLASEFMKRHPEIDFEMISGGLFVFDRKKRPYDFKEAKNINERIADYYDVIFSDAYNRYFDDETFVMNSLGPARVFDILRDAVEKHLLAELAYDIQILFFQKGLDLNESETYRELLNKYQLDSELLVDIKNSLTQQETIHKDFTLSKKLGVTSYPTMLLEKDGKFYNMIEKVQTVNDLEKNLMSLTENY